MTWRRQPLLSLHYAGYRHWWISEPFAPISVRDQMVRGKGIAEALYGEGELDPGSKLLVIGAGVAGASVAMTAAMQGATVTLVEAQPRPFSLQQSCNTRLLDPLIYDWPSEHWRWVGANTPTGVRPPYPVFPMTFGGAHAASAHAKAWETALNKVVKHNGLDLQLDTWAHPVDRKARKYYLDDGKAAQTSSFDVVVVAGGFGGETTKIHSCVGYRFWEDDPFCTANAGLSNGGNGHVIVSGGGDGALQDFVRLSTGVNSPRLVLAMATRGLPRQDYSWLHSFTDSSFRAWSLSSPRQDTPRQIRLYNAIVHWIASLPPPMKATIGGNIMGMLIGRPSVSLICRSPAPSAYYPLNLFLAVLVSSVGPRHKMYLGAQLKSATPAHGTPPTNAAGCWDMTWNVAVVDANGTQLPNPKLAQCDGIVVRHGIQAGNRPVALKLRSLRHAMPYFSFDK